MLRRASFLFLMSCALAMSQDYQFPLDLPPGTVGQPYTIFDDVSVDPGSLEGITITFTASGNIPPGMQAAPFFRYYGTPTTPGDYRFDLILTFSVPEASVRVIYNCTHRILPAVGQPIMLDPPSQTISTTINGGTQSRNLVLSNRSAQAKTFTATATTSSSRNWLTVSGGGSLGPFSSSSLSISADPQALGVGTYTGTISIAVSPTNERLSAVVLFTVTGSQQNLTLSQSGLTFQAAQGGVSPPALPFTVFNESAGTLAWTAAASTLTGGNWLTITPASGASTNLQGREIQVRANPGSLPAGDYYGQVEVRSPGAPNSPQMVTVVMNVVPPNLIQGTVATPTGLVFVGIQGGTNPLPQTVTLSALTNTPVTYQATTVTEGSTTNRFGVQQASGTTTGAQPARIAVTANISGLPAGVSNGELLLRLGDGSTRRVALLLVVRPRVLTASRDAAKDAPAAGPREADGCTPRRLLPIFTLLGNSFKVSAGWPVPVETRIVDDCGDPLTRGGVVATFSNSDAPVPLVPLLDGRWSWTWTPRNPANPVTVTVTAQSNDATPLIGTAQAGGTLQPNDLVPLVASGGVLNAASFEKLTPVAPGSLVSIFGTGLAESLAAADRLPLTTELAGTRALLGGQPLPLVFSSSGQVNAIMPTDLPPNTTMQLVVRRGNRSSAPEPVTLAAAQPGVFLAGDRGIIVGVRADGSQYTPGPGSPAAAGDVLVIFCTGLGPTNPPVPAGQAVPSTGLFQTVNPVTVTIGGQSAPVAFAGLVAGFTGLYQVNATVPDGVTPGEAQLVMSVAGQVSKGVGLTVR